MLPPVMTPPCGTQQLRFVGDRAVFRLGHPEPRAQGWRAFLRTNLTRGARVLEETLALLGQQEGGPRLHAGASWRDIPLREVADGWALDLALTEPGAFRAKAYCVDPEGFQHWPQGEDVTLSVHPDRLRTASSMASRSSASLRVISSSILRARSSSSRCFLRNSSSRFCASASFLALSSSCSLRSRISSA